MSSASSQVNLEYLESKLESIDGEDAQCIQDNVNSLFHHCVQALGEEHQIKVVNALQVCDVCVSEAASVLACCDPHCERKAQTGNVSSVLGQPISF